MGFWREAEAQAGREFGARMWRWYAARRALGPLLPILAGILVAGALLVAYRLVAPDWQAIGGWLGGWLPGALLIAIAFAALVGVAAWLVQGSRAPRRRRRFR